MRNGKSFRALGRRSFLAAGAAVATAAVLRDARAFGEVPSSGLGSMPEAGAGVDSILEVVLAGGFSQHESLLALPGFGDSAQNPEGWHSHLRSGELERVLGDCSYSGDLLTEFAPDREGNLVHLGPFIDPIRQRTDLFDAARLLVMQHSQLAHEVAIPLALAGRPLGHSGLAGLGTHIQRYFQGRMEGTASFVLSSPDPLVQTLTAAASAPGLHPAAARPILVPIDQIAGTKALLNRPWYTPEAQAVAGRITELELGRTWNAVGRGADQLRSASLSDWQYVRSLVQRGPSLASGIPDGSGTSDAELCGSVSDEVFTPGALTVASKLIRGGAKYVCVVDSGFASNGEAGGYDSHRDDCISQARNLFSLSSALADVINRPGENDPDKIDLDRTLIILNTEFGRSPTVVATGGGRGHWPGSYPVLLLNSRFRASAERVVGAVSGDFKASTGVHPTELRIGALIALGIWPFDDASYNVSDIVGASTDPAAAAAAARSLILGGAI